MSVARGRLLTLEAAISFVENELRLIRGREVLSERVDNLLLKATVQVLEARRLVSEAGGWMIDEERKGA